MQDEEIAFAAIPDLTAEPMSRAILRVEYPLLQLAGTFVAETTDVSERRDAYIGQERQYAHL